jgi:type III restriction enzyme
MADVVIENAILYSPFEEPRRHFKFSDEGITNEVVEARRVSSYFVPIPCSQEARRAARFRRPCTRRRAAPSIHQRAGRSRSK